MNISQITDYLYVGVRPTPQDVEALIDLNIRLMISMIGSDRPPEVFDRPPLRLLWLQTYDTFFTPIPVKKLMQGVQAAIPIIEAGGRVLVYCVRGRHRSVAMGAAILIARGYSAEDAMDLLRSRRPVADPRAWYIRRQIRKFEQAWLLYGAEMVT